MKRLLLVDNYDSFTYNLYQYLCELGAEVEVRRNDAVSVEAVAEFRPDGLVLSPGPGTPRDAGVCNDLIRHFGAELPILGVCLGLQCIAHSYGGRVVRAPELRHGKTSAIRHHQQGVFRRLPSPFEAVRYHSLVAEPASLPDCLEVTATTDDGLIMGLRHRRYPVQGVQFHPESILTEGGKRLLQNFLDDLQPGAGVGQAPLVATPVGAGLARPAAGNRPAGRASPAPTADTLHPARSEAR